MPLWALGRQRQALPSHEDWNWNQALVWDNPSKPLPGLPFPFSWPPAFAPWQLGVGKASEGFGL